MRRWATPLVLAAITAVAAGMALNEPAEPRSRLAGLSTPKAPVLSVRRAPALLTRTIADLKLARQLDAAVGTSTSCLVVASADRSRTLYARNADQPFIPASNLKLLTALAVLQELGPDETFVTTARGALNATTGTVEGPLYLVGGGDPVIETADYAPTRRFPTQIRTPFERLADDLVAKGLKRVTGGVVGDESRYDTQRYIPTWPERFRTQGQVGALSALAVNDGFAQLEPRVQAAQPAAHAAAVLTELLKSRGVSVDGQPGQSRAPASAASISELRSPPVREIVAEMLKESDNTTAELLVKELGHRLKGAGTTAAGLDALRAELQLPAAVQAVDGSGLDRSDRATCNVIIQALGAVPPDALPTAATDGTLSDRFLNHPAAGKLKAKTGSLNGVASLSGFAEDDLAFSLLANDVRTEAAGRALQEAVGAVLVRYPEAPNPDELAP